MEKVATFDTQPYQQEPARRGAVTITGIQKRFGATVALAGIDLTIDAGTYIVLLGPSGCGKTTLLRIIGGHESPDAGDVLLDGRSILGLPPHLRDISTVFQHYALFPHKTVYENVEFGLRMRKIQQQERHQRVQEALRLLDLESLSTRYPRQLSGGQQQRVALARALVTRPTLLLLDEPLGDLDRLLQLRMRRELRELQRRLGITFIHVTHNQEEALAIADQIVVMNAGEIQQHGHPATIYEHPQRLFVAAFMGDNNVLSGTVDAVEDEWIVVRIGDILIRGIAENARPRIGDTVHAAVRAASIRVTGDANLAAAPHNTVTARLVFKEYLGDLTKLYVYHSVLGELLVKTFDQSLASSVGEGDILTLSWEAKHVRILTQ
uniref:ABC transporter ATP-binding protein n=1 Tax=Thermorudis peleae TaxID=1382356 RepID=A0A831X7H7_9BACT